MSNNETNIAIRPNKTYRLEQEVWFDDHQFGVDESFPNQGEIEIRNGSDGLYWNGASWQAAQIWNSTSVDASGLFHYYDYSVQALPQGNTLTARIRITNDPSSEHVVNMVSQFQFEPWFPLM